MSWGGEWWVQCDRPCSCRVGLPTRDDSGGGTPARRDLTQSHFSTDFFPLPCALPPAQTPSAAQGRTERGGPDDFILVSKDDDGGSTRAPAPGQAQPLRLLRSLARPALVFSDPLTGPASAPSSNPSSSPDDDSSGHSKDSGFTIVSPLDL